VAIAQNRDRLAEATRLLQLYPSSRVGLGERSNRILEDRKLAMARLAECTQDKAAAKDSAAAPQSQSSSKPSSNPLASLTSRFSRHTTAQSQPVAVPQADPLQALTERWQRLPAKVTMTALEKDPELTQTQIQLIYDTETVTQAVCGAPSGDDALLLRIAQAPNQVEQE
jgi:hypothetical protein